MHDPVVSMEVRVVVLCRVFRVHKEVLLRFRFLVVGLPFIVHFPAHGDAVHEIDFSIDQVFSSGRYAKPASLVQLCASQFPCSLAVQDFQGTVFAHHQGMPRSLGAWLLCGLGHVWAFRTANWILSVQSATLEPMLQRTHSAAFMQDLYPWLNHNTYRVCVWEK